MHYTLYTIHYTPYTIHETLYSITYTIDYTLKPNPKVGAGEDTRDVAEHPFPFQRL